MFTFKQISNSLPSYILKKYMILGAIFILFVSKSIAQIPDVQIGFDCEPTALDNEPCMQSVCNDIVRPRTTTNPERPVNVTNRERLNSFDWRKETFPVLLSATSRIQNPLVSPFYQTDNGNISRFTSIGTQDMRLEDGWEVLKYDLGGALSAEGISTHTVIVPYVALYNRFLGKLRVFVARGDEGYATNYLDITVKFDNPNKSSLLDMHRGSLIALDAPFQKGEIRSSASMLNIPGKWSFADFPLIYDPCTCEYGKNSIKISVKNVDESTISLTGTLEGSLITRGTNGEAMDFHGTTLTLLKGELYMLKVLGRLTNLLMIVKKLLITHSG